MTESQTDEATVGALVRLLRKILTDLPEGHEITAGDRLEDLGLTSFQLMQLIAASEQEFDIEFPDSALSLTTFESVASVALVVGALAIRRSEPPTP
ncbi:acyl carrier protein [Kitasatospora sp. MAP12-15]|uniref:phosphopantetheine-binding protein n=1 Tax=unclassified Kitasatospora TaxID=2633591 RepID=UPI002474E2B9|nr:phosphopantetheine-binding protein [Kitasatospora sp. MAP12-44]MDH6108186.1 acyl carrier protein [Kitasatospora sp. MAP12-44]